MKARPVAEARLQSSSVTPMSIHSAIKKSTIAEKLFIYIPLKPSCKSRRFACRPNKSTWYKSRPIASARIEEQPPLMPAIFILSMEK